MNRYLTYQEGEFLFEDVALSEIAEEMYTPFYVYSKAAILEKVEAFKQAFGDLKPMIAFNMKALDTTLILKILKERGCSLAVSNLSELKRAIAIGFPPTSIIYNSCGLPDYAVRDLLKIKPLLINIGSIFELEPLNRIATELDTGVRIGLQINPGIDVGGIPGSNFGASNSRVGIQKNEIDIALGLIANYKQLNFVGISASLGCQVATLAPWIKLSEDMAGIFKDMKGKGFNLEYLDLGGGFPVDYKDADYLEIKKIARNIIPHVKDIECRVVLEPGRYFTAESGVLVTTVLGVKEAGEKTYVICDAGYTEFPRSAMYRISHDIAPVKEPVLDKPDQGPAFGISSPSEGPVDTATGLHGPGESLSRTEMPGDLTPVFEATDQGDSAKMVGKVTVQIVGPGWDGLDYLAKDVEMHLPKRGDLLAILNVGAYGRTMSNNYASRLRPPEVLIERDKFELIREREMVDDLIGLDMEESDIEA
ncbi:MAG: hypothetical protein NTY09_07320 [bacterium]|nr:hypothetical protein [bacterium]